MVKGDVLRRSKAAGPFAPIQALCVFSEAAIESPMATEDEAKKRCGDATERVKLEVIAENLVVDEGEL